MAAETISAIAAIAAATIALGALYFTWRQAENATQQTKLQQKMHEDAAQPYVWADIRVDPRHGQMLQFVVKNEGPTVATDVQLHINPPLRADWMLGGTDKGNGPYRQGNRFSSMPPGREMVWNLATAFGFSKSVDHKAFTVRVDAHGPYGAVQHTFVLDVGDYEGVAATAPGTLLGIQKSVER
ncbi:hypothetical protein ACQGFI_00560 [Rhodococcus sp. 2.95]